MDEWKLDKESIEITISYLINKGIIKFKNLGDKYKLINDIYNTNK